VHRTDFAAGTNNPKLSNGVRSGRKVGVYSSEEGLSVIRVNHFSHPGQVHRTFLRLQTKDAIRLIRPDDLLCLKVPFPMTHMSDALGFFKSGVAFFQLASQRPGFLVGALAFGHVANHTHVLDGLERGDWQLRLGRW